MINPVNLFLNLMKKLFSINIKIGKSLNQAKNNTLLFFPSQPNTMCCGISAFIAFKGSSHSTTLDLVSIEKKVLSLKANGLLPDA